MAKLGIYLEAPHPSLTCRELMPMGGIMERLLLYFQRFQPPASHLIHSKSRKLDYKKINLAKRNFQVTEPREGFVPPNLEIYYELATDSPFIEVSEVRKGKLITHNSFCLKADF